MIFVFGTICLDHIRRVERLPDLGGYAEILEQRTFLGGEAANSAVAIARLGGNVRLAGNPVGNDHGGEVVRMSLRAESLTLGRSATSKTATPFCDVYVTEGGERTMFGWGFLGLGDVTDLSGLTYTADHWFTCDPNLESAPRTAVTRASEAGMQIYLLDFLEPDDPIPAGCWWQTSTHRVGTEGRPEESRRFLAGVTERHSCWGILTDGAEGAWIGDPSGEVVHVPTFVAFDAIDSTGAGDVFRGAMLTGLDEGLSLGDCLVLAGAAGCLNCRGWGGNSGAPTRFEIDQLVADQAGVADQIREAVRGFAVSC